MALDQSALLELAEMVQRADGGDLMRKLLETMLQALVDAQATAHIGAAPHERTDTRTTQRNGSRPEDRHHRRGRCHGQDPEDPDRGVLPVAVGTSPAHRRRAACGDLPGVCRGREHPPGRRPGCRDGRHRDQQERGQPDLRPARSGRRGLAQPAAGRDRLPLRVPGRDLLQGPDQPASRSQAVVIATGVSADGRREVLGCAVGDSETQGSWTEFLRSLRDRGLDGVQLVISDSHRGLTNAIGTVLQGVSWQRCRVHFMRNALAKVNKGHAEMVAATIRTVFAQPTPATVREQVEQVADTLQRQFPAVADLLRDAKADLTAFADFPHAHWRKIWSTNPLERLNREVKRRTDVVGIFPNVDALLRLSACVLIEAHDEWQDSDRRYLSEESMALLNPPAPTAIEPRRDAPSEVMDQPARQTA